MTLLTPALAVAGLCAIAIPILIHLLMRQRRKPIEFAAMRFLIEAFRRHRRRLQLEQMILLATRCLILALLGLALARPLLDAAGVLERAGGGRTVTLVIDDGLASGAVGENRQTALVNHVNAAIDIIRALAPGDTVSVITAGRPARALLSPPSSDHAAVINLLRSLEPRQSPTDLAGAMMFVRQAAAEARQASRPAVVYLLSEFRAGSAAIDSPLPATQADVEGARIQLLALPASVSPLTNIQVASIEPVRSVIVPNAGDGSDQVRVRLARSGGELGADISRVRLDAEGLAPIPPRIVRWQPGQSHAEVDFALDFGLSSDRKVALTASLLDDDALSADNSRHAVVDLRSQIRVLLIDRRSFGFERTLDQLSAGQWLRRALEPLGPMVVATPRTGREAAGRTVGAGGGITVTEAEPAAFDVADLRTADVAIAPRPDLINERGWRLLREFVQRGGLLVITPPGELAVHPWIAALNTVMNLPWNMALEPRDHPEGLPLAVEQPPSEILRLILNDLPEMARAVQVYRTLAVNVGGANTQAQIAGAQQDATGSAATTLLRLADGSPLLVVGNPSTTSTDAQGEVAASVQGGADAGLVMYLAVAPEVGWTNLPTKPMMVPLIQETVRQGLSVIRAANRAEAGDRPTLTQAGTSASDLRAPDGRVIPLQRGRPQEPLERAGVYHITDASEQSVGLLAVNVDPRAGLTDVQSAAAVNAWLTRSGPWKTFDPTTVSAALSTTGGGSPISGILVAAVIVLLVLETLLARWFSHAYRADGDTASGSIVATVGGSMRSIAGGAAAQGGAA